MHHRVGARALSFIRALTSRPAASLLAAGLAAAIASPAAAQVGHLPTNSPFRDLTFSQALTIFGGTYVAAKDLAGVAPRSGPLAGVGYDAHIGGPAYLTVN